MYPFKPYLPQTGFAELIRGLVTIAFGIFVFRVGISAGAQFDQSHFMLGWAAPGLVIIATGLGTLVKSVHLLAKRL